MEFFTFLFELAVFGCFIYIITICIPMPEAFQKIILGLAIIGILIWVLHNYVGYLPHLGRIK